MMTRKRTIPVLGAAAVLMLAALPALAQGPHGHGKGLHHGGGPGMGHGRLLQELDLSQEQRDAIGDLLLAHRTAMRGQRDAMRAARGALMDATHAETLDEAAVRAAAAEVAALEADRAVARARVFQQVQAILTPEQRTELQQRIAERRAEGPRGRGGPGPRWDDDLDDLDEDF